MRARRPPRGRQKRPSRSDRARRRPAHAVQAAEKRITVSLPSRRFAPERVVAHLGPTNSGKTYAALRELADKRAGVYAGPLRMLAQEAHRRLGEWIGAENVGLVTGEERINERAPVICSTVEMAPHAGELLVLDEVQWADDPERGSAWTRLLLAGEYREILLLGALDALPLVERAFPEHELKLFERKLPLEFVGERTLRSLTPGTVVVAFSRRAVLALAGEVNRLHPGRVAVLYGAMPLASRREEIDRFLSGAADVCVATDVLGHGVNLPCETLLFAETNEVRRRGATRPAALGARTDRGTSRPLRSRRARPRRRARRARMGSRRTPRSSSRRSSHMFNCRAGTWGYRAVDEARIRPQLSDLGVDDPVHLDAALVAWHRVALREWAFESWLAVESLQPLRLRLQAVQRRLGERGRRLSLADTWKLVNAPVDEDGLELLATLALAITGDRVARPQLAFLLDTARLRGASLEDAERAGREASILRWFALAVRGRGRRDDRARRCARAGRGRAGRRTAPRRGRVTDDRPLPVVWPFVRSVVPALRPVRRDRGAVVI